MLFIYNNQQQTPQMYVHTVPTNNSQL